MKKGKVNKKIKKRKPATVRCGICKKEYPSNIWIFQGDGIASDLSDLTVVSYFGSEFDGGVHFFERPIEERVEKFFADKECSICDRCIQNLIDQKRLVLVHSTFA